MQYGTEKYVTFSVPVEKKITGNDENGEQITNTI